MIERSSDESPTKVNKRRGTGGGGILIRERNACSLTRLPRRKEPREFGGGCVSHRLCVWRSSKNPGKTRIKKKKRKREKREKGKTRTAQRWNAEISCDSFFFTPGSQPTSDGQENWTDDFSLVLYSRLFFPFFILSPSLPDSHEQLINNATNLCLFSSFRANKLIENAWFSSTKISGSF